MAISKEDIEAIKAALKPPERQGYSNSVLIVQLIIMALAPTLAVMPTYFQVNAAKATTEETRRIAAESSTTLKEVQHSVNSTAASAVSEIKELKQTILQMSVNKAVSDERERDNKPRPTP